MSTGTAIESDDRRFGRAARRLGTASIIVRAVAVSFLLFFLVSVEGYGNRHPFGALPAVMGISSLGHVGLFVGFPLAFLLSVAGLFKANSGRIVGVTYTEARKWSNILMLLIGFDLAVLITAGLLALLPARPKAPSTTPGVMTARRPPNAPTAKPLAPPSLAIPPRGVPVTRRSASDKMGLAKDWQKRLVFDRTALTRDVVAEKLIARGQEAVPELIRGASKGDRYVRLASLAILAEMVESGAAKADPKSRPGMEKNPTGDPYLGQRIKAFTARIFDPAPSGAEPSLAEQIREILDALDMPKTPGRPAAPRCVVSLKDGSRRAGALITASIGITAESGQVEIRRDRLLHLRFGDLARGEKSEALTLDGAVKGWADVADIELQTADGALSLPRSRVREIEITSRRTPEQLLSLYGRPGLALAYANAAATGRALVARKLSRLLVKSRSAEADRPRSGGQNGSPGEAGIGRIDKNSSLIASGGDQGQIALSLLLDGERIPIARYDIGGARFLGRPLVLDAKAYVGGESPSGFGGGLYAIDLLSGKRLWEADIGTIRYANAAAYQDLLFVASGGTGGTGRPGEEPDHGDAGLYAVRIDTGRVEWFVPLDGAGGGASPVVENGAVALAVSPPEAKGAPPRVLRFRAEDGAPIDSGGAPAEVQKAR